MPSEFSSVISLRDVWKRYGLPLPFMRRPVKANGDGGSRPWVLRGVDLDVRKGEMFAILGRNGSGKSTLLRIIAGVTPPTHGHVEVRGDALPVIDLNSAVHPELTGRENARLLGAIAGVSLKAMTHYLDAVGEFTELGPWFNRPVRTYSTGMCARLGVAAAATVESDILLIDEALAVGDLAFQNKCLRRLRELRQAGRTVVLISHNLDLVQAIADRALLLENGEVRFIGSAHEAVCTYEDSVFGAAQRGTLTGRDGLRSRWHGRVYGVGGGTTASVSAGTPFGLEVQGSHEHHDAPWLLSVSWVNIGGVVCVWHVIDVPARCADHGDRGFRLRLWYPENHLVKGLYTADLRLITRDSFETLATLAGVASVQITASHRARGIAAMTADCVVERGCGHASCARTVETMWSGA